MVQCLGGQVPAVSWAAKQVAIGEDRGSGEAARGRCSGGGTTLEASYGVYISSRGMLLGEAASGVGSSQEVAAPQG